jgi:hypothetical protein
MEDAPLMEIDADFFSTAEYHTQPSKMLGIAFSSALVFGCSSAAGISHSTTANCGASPL